VAFEQIVLRAGGDRFGRERFVVLAAENHDRQRRRRFADAMERIDALRVGERHVEQRDVEGALAQSRFGIADALRERGLVGPRRLA